MKHINTFKLFESSDLEIKQELEERKQYLYDIFQELLDKNFVISVISKVVGSSKCFLIAIGYRKGFKYEEVSDYIGSSDSYMSSSKYNKTVFEFKGPIKSFFYKWRCKAFYREWGINK